MIILNITRNHDGQYEIVNATGKLVEGPFETNAAAWKALDRLDSDAAVLPRKRNNKQVLWGKPEQPAKQNKRQKRLAAKQERQMQKAAAKAPGWVRAVAAKKFDPVGERAYRDHKLGTFGAASEVRRIDPATYLAEKQGSISEANIPSKRRAK
ncbi:hypothetical protein DTW90_18550 [Neorhizobium sp. P12A]|uniref:hypothetical protein n=1 Tax=Neorhizobium sp. P12A TaxID=2268027 RepID=UPI0011EC08BD|nr:hypothetical protein [Neorhizobium sp. P12A]KAA0697431.1 hypothetical protein DTW90_18550 [Neorhizobium sp. P12A]